LLAHGRDLGFADVGITEIGLGGHQLALRRVNPALRRHHRGGLLRSCRIGKFGLPLRYGAALGELGISVLVEQRELIRRLLLRQLRLGLCQVGFRFADPASRIDFRLLGVQLRLSHLLIQHRDLVTRRARLRFRMRQRGAGLILTGANLVIVENRNDVAGLDAVAFADPDLEDAAAQLGRDHRFVGFDAAAQRDDPLRRCGRGEAAPQHHRRNRDDRDKE
jgi:hypothetical protein